MAQAPQKDTNAELDAVKADLAQLRGDMGDLVKAVKEQNEARVRDGAGQARDEAKAVFEEGLDTLNRGYQQAREHGEKRVDEAEQMVGRHPLTSVVAAFGVGFVIAKLFDGGRR
ncbi:MAG: YqjD family protein [Guyparkeria sp.]